MEKKGKVRITLWVEPQVKDRIKSDAASMGVSASAYVSMLSRINALAIAKQASRIAIAEVIAAAKSTIDENYREMPSRIERVVRSLDQPRS